MRHWNFLDLCVLGGIAAVAAMAFSALAVDYRYYMLPAGLVFFVFLVLGVVQGLVQRTQRKQEIDRWH